MIVPEESGMLAEVSIKAIKEAIKGPDVDEWYSAMAKELRSIIENNVWGLVDRRQKYCWKSYGFNQQMSTGWTYRKA